VDKDYVVRVIVIVISISCLGYHRGPRRAGGQCFERLMRGIVARLAEAERVLMVFFYRYPTARAADASGLFRRF